MTGRMARRAIQRVRYYEPGQQMYALLSFTDCEVEECRKVVQLAVLGDHNGGFEGVGIVYCWGVCRGGSIQTVRMHN